MLAFWGDEGQRGSLREERVRDFVTSKYNALIGVETTADHVSQRMVFLIESEDGRRRDSWSSSVR